MHCGAAGRTLLQAEEELGQGRGGVGVPALGLGRGPALRQTLAPGGVARGAPQGQRRVGVAAATLGRGRLAGRGLAVRRLRGQRVRPRGAGGAVPETPGGGGSPKITPTNTATITPGREGQMLHSNLNTVLYFYRLAWCN